MVPTNSQITSNKVVYGQPRLETAATALASALVMVLAIAYRESEMMLPRGRSSIISRNVEQPSEDKVRPDLPRVRAVGDLRPQG